MDRRRSDGGAATHVPQPLGVRDYYNVVRRRAGIVVLFFVAVVFVVTVGSFVMEPVYRATATLLIDTESPDVLTSSGTVTLEAKGYYSYKDYYQSQAEIITSYSILKKVFNEFSLGSSKEYRTAKEPIKKFSKTVKVVPVRDTRLLRLSVENADPVLAAKLANRIADIYVKRNLYYISRTEMTNLLKNEYLKMEARLAEYSKIYKSKHPKMIRLKKEMAELGGRIEREKQLALSSDMDAVDTELLESFTDEKYALDGFKANNVSIQDPAETPIVPVRPRKLLNILIALVVGAVGGVGLAFFFEYLDDTVKETEDVERIAAWPFLGNIPRIGGRGKKAESERGLYAHLNPKDPAAEAYRLVRTSVLFSSTEEHPVKALAVTSPGPQEGKTTTLCNLGIALAQIGKRVVIVDADMRKSRLHEVFGKDNTEGGLSSFLSAQAGLDGLVEATEVENLSLVKSGPHPPNPSELIASNKMKDLVARLKKEFDLVLFDTPPVAMLTDAVILSGLTDGMVIVIESGRTSKRAIARIAKLLHDTNIKVVGTIINRISPSSSSYHYYSYYYDKPKQ